MYYEQYVLGEISLDEFKLKQQNLRQAAEDQKAILAISVAPEMVISTRR